MRPIRWSTTLVAAVAAFGLVTSAASAATVDFELIYDPAGTFEVIASASAGDNAGISGYNFELEGVDDFTHAVPRGVDNTAGFPMGFTVGNNDSTLTGPSLTGTDSVFAGQNTSSSDAPDNLLYEIGQTAGSAAAESMAFPVVSTWGAPIQIGTGNFTGDVPTFGSASANVFDALNQVGTSSAEVNTTVSEVPEPASVGLVSLGALALLGRRRRRRA